MTKHTRASRKPKNLFQLGLELRKAHSAKLKQASHTRKREELKEKQRAEMRVKNYRVRYTATENILIVGDGNCSFGRALVRHFRQQILNARERRHQVEVRQRTSSIQAELAAEHMAADLPVPDNLHELAQAAAELELKRSTTTQYGVPFDDVLDAEDPEETEAVESLNCNYKRKRLTLRNCGMRLLVTCYDSQEVAVKKYDDLPEILEELHSAGARVVFGVDAMSMQTSLSEAGLVPITKFDHIIFNFPHVGSGNQVLEESVRENQGLILGFLANALPLVRNPKKYGPPPRPFYAKRNALVEDCGDLLSPGEANKEEHEKGGNHKTSEEAKASSYDDDDDDEEDEDEDGDQDNEYDDEDDGSSEGISMEELEQLSGPAPARFTNAQLVSYLQKQDVFGMNIRKKKEILDRGGEIHVTLKLGEPYDSWKIGKVAETLNQSQRQAQEYKETMACVNPGEYDGKFPKLDLLRGIPFVPSAYSGYTHRRTIGFKHDLSADANQDISKGSRTYIFTRSLSSGRVKDEDDDEAQAEKLQRAKLQKQLKPKQRKQKSGRSGKGSVGKRKTNR